MPDVCTQFHLGEDQALALFADDVYLAASASPVAHQDTKSEALQIGGSIPLSRKTTSLRWRPMRGLRTLPSRLAHSPIANCAEETSRSLPGFSRSQKLNR